MVGQGGFRLALLVSVRIFDIRVVVFLVGVHFQSSRRSHELRHPVALFFHGRRATLPHAPARKQRGQQGGHAHTAEQGGGPDELHENTGGQRAENGAAAVQHLHAGGGFEHVLRVDVVVGVRGRQRKHAEPAGAVQQAADKNQLRVNLDKPQGKKGAHGGNQADPGQHGAAVEAVGQAAYGPQHDDAAQNGGAHEGGNTFGVQPYAGGHDRRQAPERAGAYAGKKRADHEI